jgi:hypothetical protein
MVVRSASNNGLLTIPKNFSKPPNILKLIFNYLGAAQSASAKTGLISYPL